MITKRLGALADIAKRRELAAVALVPGSNLRYFADIAAKPSERAYICMVTPQAELALVVPELEHVGLDLDADVAAFVWGDHEGPDRALNRLAATLALQGKRIGVDGMTMRLSEWLALTRQAPGLEAVSVEGDLMRVRSIKDEDELALMRRAVDISEQALKQLASEIEPGVRERQVAMRLDQLAAELGSEGPAFATSVLFGSQSAHPHGKASARQLREGEALLIDFGATVEGYAADITRTFCVGEAPPELFEMHRAVLAANQAAVAIAGPGVPMGDVDRAARQVLEDAGLGPRFIHRTGHGIGLDVHEPIPQIAAGVDDPLAEGMAFTIEPGVYVPDSAGVRIEDDVCVTASGVEVLTSYPRELALK